MMFKRRQKTLTRADALAAMQTEINAAISKAAGHHVDLREIADTLEQMGKNQRLRDVMMRPIR